MGIKFTAIENPWVAVKKRDPSFQLQGPLTVTNRASIQFNNNCPRAIMNDIAVAIEQGWIELVAHVPKNDPTLMWDILQKEHHGTKD